MQQICSNQSFAALVLHKHMLQNSSTCSSSRLRSLLGVLGIHGAADLQQGAAALLTQGSSGSSSGSSRGIVTGHTHIPRKKHDPYRTPPKNYVQLLQHITRSRDVQSLSRLVRQYGKKFDAVHVAAAVARLPKLYQPPSAPGSGSHLSMRQVVERKKSAAMLMAQLQVTASSLVPRMFAGQVSSITYALARTPSLLPGGTAANSNTQRLLHSMLSRVAADEARLLWQGANGTHVMCLLHGIARLGFNPSSNSSNSNSSSAAAAAGQATKQLCKIIARDPDRLQVRELATAAWALGRISRKRPGLCDTPSTAAALDAISAAVVARKLYLRPNSMTGLLTASTWLRRRDEALLGAVAEEAIHQLRDLRPPHLAAFARSFSKLQYSPPPELTAGLISQARRQLEHFTAASLGLLLQGLQGMGALDKQLLADIAAGIAAEQEVSLAPRDAVRILAPFIAVPDAGSVRDVERMAQLIAAAVRREARNASPATITDLVVIYSKLPYHHPMLLSLLGGEVPQKDVGGGSSSSSSWRHDFTMSQLMKLLQSAARLGYARVVADPAVETQLIRFYAAAEERLLQHLQQVVLPAAAAAAAAAGGDAAAAQQQQQLEEGAGDSLLDKVKRFASPQSTAQQQQQGQEHDDEQQQQPRLHGRRKSQQAGGVDLSAVIEVGQLLAQRGRLGEAAAGALSDAGVALLPRLKLRQIMQLLTALTSRDGGMLGHEPVRRFVSKAAEHMTRLDLSNTPTATTTVLVGLLPPLSKAISRNLALASGQPVVQAVYAELLPVLEECSQQQLQAVYQAMRLSGVEDEALLSRAKDVAQRNGWLLHPGALSVM